MSQVILILSWTKWPEKSFVRAQLLSFFYIVMEGSFLRFQSVVKEDMGAFLCIASNGIPPLRSKRFTLNVLCEYDFSYEIYNPQLVQRL